MQVVQVRESCAFLLRGFVVARVIVFAVHAVHGWSLGDAQGVLRFTIPCFTLIL